ncbi:MAG: exosortase/archaeosortase family protein [Fimbriiglobus sp.]
MMWRTSLVLLVPCGLLTLWAYLPTFQFLIGKWTDDPQYSHGFLVPAFSAYLLYRRYQAGLMGLSAPWTVLGLVILGLLVVARGLAGGLMFHQLDCLALVFSVVALVMMAGGKKLLIGVWPGLVFLAFMIPLPYEMERNLGGPLKNIATTSSTYLLQTLGLPAIAEGHIILIDEVRLGVVDACSGLKMLMTFSAFAVGAVLMLDRTRFEKLLILMGIVPIALIVNILRITATGIAYTLTDDKNTLNWVHDIHGWLMMPAGLGLLGLQLATLSRLVVPAETTTTNPAYSGIQFA